MKTLLKVLGALLGILLLVAGAGYWAWTANKDAILAAAATETDAGLAEGRGTDEAGCLTLAAAAHKARAQEMTAALRGGMRLRACLEAARTTPGFCEGVPRASEPFAAGAWAGQRCAELKLADPYCAALVQQVPVYCADPGREDKRRREAPAG